MSKPWSESAFCKKLLLPLAFLLTACTGSPTGNLSGVNPQSDPQIIEQTDPPTKMEFTAFGSIACGGTAPLPGCVYLVEAWVGASGPVSPGNHVKILLMNPRSRADGSTGPDTSMCQGYQVEAGAYSPSDRPVRVRARGEPCDWDPELFFCVCDAGDFVRFEP